LSYRINKKGRKLVFVGFNFQKLKDFIIAVCNLYKIGPYKNKGIRLRYEIIFRKKVKRKDKRKKIKK
jgi:ribosomal protein L6P/L9E